MKLPVQHPLRVTLKEYGDKSLLNLLAFRSFAGSEFLVDHKHDVIDFLSALFKKCDLLSNVTTFEAVKILMCTSCHTQQYKPYKKNFFNIYVKNDPKSTYDLKDLMKVGNFKRKFNDICPTCQTITAHEEMNEIKIANKIIILRIMLSNDHKDANASYSNAKINSVPTYKYKLNKQQYCVTSALFYKGNVNSGDYSIMIRDDKNAWIHADNMEIHKQSWPKSSKNAFLLVLEQK